MNRKSGISLLELIVTICIIGVLMGLIMPAIGSVRKHAKEKDTVSEIVQLDTALMAYFTDNGCYPESNQMLACLNDKYFDFEDSRVQGKIYNDKLGGVYFYMSPGIISSKGYDLYSLGLLKAQGDINTLGILFSAATSSIYTTDGEIQIKIGDPTGLGQKGIWGLAEPTYDYVIGAALELMRYTDRGFALAMMINIANIPIGWYDFPDGILAGYSLTTHQILLDTSLYYGPSEVIAAIIAHEATHLAENLSNGDIAYDSIDEEYKAKYNEAMVWKELKEDKVFENLDSDSQANVNMENAELDLIEQGEEKAKETLRQRYPNIPDESQWGDPYVVPGK